jgi:hypothetical protein
MASVVANIPIEVGYAVAGGGIGQCRGKRGLRAVYLEAYLAIPGEVDGAVAGCGVHLTGRVGDVRAVRTDREDLELASAFNGHSDLSRSDIDSRRIEGTDGLSGMVIVISAQQPIYHVVSCRNYACTVSRECDVVDRSGVASTAVAVEVPTIKKLIEGITPLVLPNRSITEPNQK